MTDANPDRTALYRIRGEGDELIYIGITTPGIPFRWNGHQAVQPWWDEVRSLTVDWYDTRAGAEEAEKAAILAEQPKYNVTYLRPVRADRDYGHEVVPVGWEDFELEPRDDDEDLLCMEDIARMLRLQSSTSALYALKRTGGPAGFTLIKQQLFRKGEIRQWIAAIEASQRDGRPLAQESGDSTSSAA